MRSSEFSIGSRDEMPTARPAGSDDVRAVAAALALCFFLWGLKLYLVGWYVFAKGIHPLSDAPRDGVLFLGGADLFLCSLLACLYRAIYPLRRLASFVPIALIFLVHAAMVVFAVVSLPVNQIYTW